MSRTVGIGVTLLVLLLVALATTAPPPATMMHIRYSILPGGVKAGNYRLERIEFRRAGDRFLREDRLPSKDNDFLSTVIAADGDIWTVHEKWRYAFHFPNPDTTLQAVNNVFHGARLNIYGDLEFGREGEYFAMHGTALPSREIHRRACDVSQLVIDSTTLTLFVLKNTRRPFVLEVVDGRYDYEVRYDLFESAVPFDSTLFVLPDSVRVIN